MRTDTIERALETPEDAVRRYDMAGLDGWVDEPDHSDGWGWIAFAFSILAFAALCFCAGLSAAAAWSAYDAAPARGVMDQPR